ncbi:TetR/AcrR family transcriptional regulator [Embleya sp. NPDC059259]|uniref:TetR/AcrR family transcriptional regulator n=1 Tax=unclassified Embleya TaxID=2699296 RepID=UPI0036C0FA02
MESPVTATRLRLMVTAERLFAVQGINAVSAREIAVAAGQRNTNAVKYHFGPQQALVDAIFEYRMSRIDARRTGLIDTYDRAGRATDPYALAEAFVLPLAELMDELRAGEDGASHYLRFCVQAAYAVHPDVATPGPEGLGTTPWATGLKLLNDRALALSEGAPTPRVARRRWEHFAGFAMHALAERELRLECDPAHKPDPTDLYVAELVDAGAAMLTGPSRPSTLALAPAGR